MQMGRRRVLGLMPLLGVAACSDAIPIEMPSSPSPSVAVESVPGASGAADITEVHYKTDRALPAAVKPSGKAMQQFAATFWDALPATDQNLAASPCSLAAVLNILGMGANGKLLEQYQQVLGGEMDTVAAQLTSIENQVEEAVSRGGEEAQNRNNPEDFTPRWRAINALFLDRQTTFDEDFLRRIYTGLGASGYQVDFARDPGGVRKAINSFVAEQTNDLIKELLDESAITASTILVALNTLWLKFAWQNPAIDLGSGIDFQKTDSKANVPAILLKDAGRQASGQGWKSATVPMLGSRMGVTFILPDQWPWQLSAEMLSTACWAPAATVEVTVPKFKVVGDFNLKSTLISMGLTDAFSTAYERICETPIGLTEVVQKCIVSLDETGIEAAAATAAVLKEASAEEPAVRLVLDRPFWFVVHDLKSNAPLFLGSVTDPKY